MNELAKKHVESLRQIRQERSPSSPTAPLADAIEAVRKLYSKAGKAKIDAITAAKALGYNGLSGASLTALALLRSYGLIDREHGEGLAVSAAAIKLIHPVDKAQEEKTKVELALTPKVFKELFTDGFSDSDEELLANHLVQNGLIPDRAKKSAAAYCANYKFANLSKIGIFPAVETDTKSEKLDESRRRDTIKTTIEEEPDETPKCNVLAKYSIPLGANEATLVFTGQGELSPDDFDALAEYVTLFKKQLERKIKTPSKIPTLTQEESDAEAEQS